ncbi:hypothetical protein L1887_45224 [Cichorium endivia]|nr:hypothetical protein L1887_45224 [Cichorium endivia]
MGVRGRKGLSMVEGYNFSLISGVLFMRNFDLSPLYRSAIGFDRLFNHLENNQSQSNGYPPYNVELVDENHYRIAIAVAGFAENELEITAQDNLLVVKGSHTAEQKERTYLYQGIAERNFERKFQLAENIHVKGANLVNGLLFIELERVIPEEKKPRRLFLCAIAHTTDPSSERILSITKVMLRKWVMSDIALTVSVLALVAVVGLWIGNIKIRGVGFGIGGVLFGGIFVGHFADKLGLVLSAEMLHFTQEFGLILFVYTIGIQVGPGFFASLRVSGLRLNLFALGIVVMGGLVTAILHKIFDIPLPVVLGIFSGAVTNTPALGAGQQILRDLGIEPGIVDQMGMSYAMAYPFGICGILLSMWLVRVLFRINVDKEAKDHETTLTNGHMPIKTINIRVDNPNLNNMAIQDVPILNSANIICSRLKRDDMLMVPAPGTVIQQGDLLHLVGQPGDLNNARLVIGQEVDTSLSTRGTDMRVERVVVTNEHVLGKKIRDLQVKERYDVVISRLNRAGVELVASPEASLQFGDILNLVGRPSSIDAVADMVGNAQQKLQQVQMLPVFIGIGLGVLLGSIPVYVPGFPVALKLGLAGGPADYGVDPRAYRLHR